MEAFTTLFRMFVLSALGLGGVGIAFSALFGGVHPLVAVFAIGFAGYAIFDVSKDD